MLATFFKPYFIFLYSAAYSIQQTLEGLGWSSSNFLVRDASGAITDSYWSASEAVLAPLGVLLIFTPVLAGLQLTALRWLAGWRAFFMAVLVLLIPGVLSLLGVGHTMNWLPDTYWVGTGALGSGWGTFALLVICLSLGWTIVVMLTKAANLTDRFRHGYDQVWYSLGIAAAVFFVSDLDAGRRKEELKDVVSAATAASKVLLDQARQLDQQCTSGHWNDALACSWSKNVQWVLSSYASAGERTYSQTGPESESEVYSAKGRLLDPQEVDAIRLALLRYDRAQCPIVDLGNGVRQHARLSSRCQLPLNGHCSAFAERPLAGLKPTDAIAAAHAIANECIVPALVASKKRQERLISGVKNDERFRHVRWAFLLLVTVIAGGKVANASVRFVGARSASNQADVAASGNPERGEGAVDTPCHVQPCSRPRTGIQLSARRARLQVRWVRSQAAVGCGKRLNRRPLRRA